VVTTETYNSLLNAYGKNSDFASENAERWLKRMKQSGIPRNLITHANECYKQQHEQLSEMLQI
jgi:pentatricopeptide repeat protein